jgi:hypothetical protein
MRVNGKEKKQRKDNRRLKKRLAGDFQQRNGRTDCHDVYGVHQGRGKPLKG